MRLVDILPDSFLVSPYLVERNIINADQVKKAVGELSAHITSKEGQRWFRTQFFKYLVNRMPEKRMDISLVNASMLTDTAPEWARKELAAGNKLYAIKFSPYLLQSVSLVIKWINHLNPQKSVRITWEDALEKSRSWKEAEEERKRLEKKAEEEKKALEKIETIIEYPKNGYRWVQLMSNECITDEGKRMNNCLRHHKNEYQDTIRYYSLRTSEGKSLATVRTFIRKNGSQKLDEAKAKSNKQPDQFYEYIFDLAHKVEIELTTGWHDLTRKARRSGYFVPFSGRALLYTIKDIPHKSVMTTTNGHKWVEVDNDTVIHRGFYLLGATNKPFLMLRNNVDDTERFFVFDYASGIPDRLHSEPEHPHFSDIMELKKKLNLDMYTKPQ